MNCHSVDLEGWLDWLVGSLLWFLQTVALVSDAVEEFFLGVCEGDY
jgi:hypothetical protein